MEQPHVFGSSYYPPHHDPADWPRDLDRMYAAGQRLVRTAELLASWDRLEIAKHTYDWSWLDTFVDLLEERGMQVLLGTGSQNPPIWMVDEHDDLQVVARDGVPYPTAAMWAWACKDHPAYRAEAERHVRTLAGRYGERPALYGWQVDNEPGYPFIPWRGERMAEYCYCPHTEAAWRHWLQQRYGNLEALSDAWRWDPTHHRYSSWTQVRAPRATPSEWGVVTAWLDWREFTAERLTGWVAWQSDLLRELTPGRPTSTNVFIWSRNDAFGVRMGQDPWRLARVVDAIGYDLYPGIEKRFLRQPGYVGMVLDHARSAAAAAGVPLWLPEIESGPLNGWALGPDHATTPADITRLCADVLGTGSRLTLYQGWREWPCIPIHWGALVDFDGEPTPRHDAAAAVAHAVAREPELFARAEAAPPVVGILVDHANAVAMQGMGADDVLLEAIEGAYAALHGFEVGFLTPAELDTAAHRLVVAPFLLLVADETGAALRRYVERGGHLLTFAKTAMLDGRGWSHRLRPGAGLDTLLGVVEESIDTVADGDAVLLRVPGGAAVGAHHVQRLRVTEPDVLVVGTYKDGSPALSRRPVGDGVAWACGTHLDLGVARHGDAGAAALIGSVASAAGATPLWTSPLSADRQHRVWARLRRDGDVAVLTVTSTDAVPRTARVHLTAAGVRDLLSGEELPGGTPVEVTVPAYGARLLRVEGVGQEPGDSAADPHRRPIPSPVDSDNVMIDGRHAGPGRRS